uniref:Neuronal PAS domain-containing protein 4-like n=2 Tax=Hirondellea gigas TaxID=1518452 RepID=A0A6A7G6S6_9CRUS
MQEIIQMCSFEGSKSTRGASKMRRDLINSEIKQLRELLPLPPSTRQRLSQLQLMALVCVYVRKSNYFQHVFKNREEPPQLTPNLGFSKALNGFIMMMTQGGKLLFISDNAAEYLGHSMEDLLIHGDSVFDILDKQDHAAVQAELLRTPQDHNDDDRLFLCRMNVSRNARRQMRFGDQKVVLVHGHFLSYLPLCSRNEPVFLAHCSPVAMPETRESVVQGATNIFTTLHTLDMKILSIDKNGEFYLGYSKASLTGVSWYHLIHPDNLKDAQSKHRIITSSDQERSCILLLRLQAAGGSWRWVHCVLQVKDAQESGAAAVTEAAGLSNRTKELESSADKSSSLGSTDAAAIPKQPQTSTNASENSPNAQQQTGLPSHQSIIVATNQVLGEREAAILRSNTWLYQYYSMQTKIQYNLAYEAQRVQAYYPQMMQYQTDATSPYMSPYTFNVNQQTGYSSSTGHSPYSLPNSSSYLQHYHYPLRLHAGFDYSRDQYGYMNITDQSTGHSHLHTQSLPEIMQQNQVSHQYFGNAAASINSSMKSIRKPNPGRPSSRKSSPVNGMSTNGAEQGGGGVAVATPVPVRPTLPTQNKVSFQLTAEDTDVLWKTSPKQVVPEYTEYSPYVTPPYSKVLSPAKPVGIDSPSPEYTDQRVPSVGGIEAPWITELQTRPPWVPPEEPPASMRLYHQT